MRVATFELGGNQRLGVVRGERIVDVARVSELRGEDDARGAAAGMLALIAGGAWALEHVATLADDAPEEAALPLETVTLLAPIPRLRKNVFCLGRNYAEHAAESLRAIGQKVKLPTFPNIFTKAVTAVTGPYAEIPFDPAVSEKLDWEVELAVVIGEGGRDIPRQDALRHVFGYAVFNDVSARDIQNRPGVQWFLGKSLERSSPFGPWIVTSDEVPDPRNLRLRLSVNGETKQDGMTADMIFDVATIIETLSHVLTLEPGDLIATGTPAGVGFGRTPPEFLRPGDMMESTIEGIGTLRNRIVQVRRP